MVYTNHIVRITNTEKKNHELDAKEVPRFPSARHLQSVARTPVALLCVVLLMCQHDQLCLFVAERASE